MHTLLPSGRAAPVAGIISVGRRCNKLHPGSQRLNRSVGVVGERLDGAHLDIFSSLLELVESRVEKGQSSLVVTVLLVLMT